MKIIKDFAPSQTKLDSLIKLIETGTENPCRDSFVDFSESLAHRNNINLDYAITEYVSYGGIRSDLIICGATSAILQHQTDISILEKTTFIYEFKSPKARMFTKAKGRNILIPSEDLITGETQIADYLDKIQTDHGNLRRQVLASNLTPEIGGIIIGRSSELDDPEVLLAFDQRRKVSKVPIFTWDQIIKTAQKF